MQATRPFQYHGEDTHQLLNIPDLKIVDLVISNAIGRGEKYVYFLDIGAGDFQWLSTLSAHINNEYSESGITFHLWGVTERKTDNTKTEEVLNGYTVECIRRKDGCCKFHQYTSFPIENIAALLTGPQNRFDLIVSNCTFSHMRDPAGTFIQAYNLLRPNTGLLITDSFNVDFMLDPTVPPDNFIDFSDSCVYRKFDVFLDVLGVKYMTRLMKNFGNIYNHNVIKKGATSLTMPISYAGDSISQSDEKICCFHRTESQWIKHEYADCIFPCEVVRYRDRFWPQVREEHFPVKGKNYKDFLYMFVPIIQEKRNMQAMETQKKSSGLACQMNARYAAALPAFHKSAPKNFATFYQIEYDKPIIEEQETEDMKETLRFLQYILVKTKQSYFR